MYARFSHYRINPNNIEPMVRQVEEDFYPNYLAKLPGLIAHHVVQIAEEEIISLSLWASQDSAEASVAIAVKYARENMADTFDEIIHSGAGRVLFVKR
jgi:heme-degrading monooxygenase HmoA